MIKHGNGNEGFKRHIVYFRVLVMQKFLTLLLKSDQGKKGLEIIVMLCDIHLDLCLY